MISGSRDAESRNDVEFEMLGFELRPIALRFKSSCQQIQYTIWETGFGDRIFPTGWRNSDMYFSQIDLGLVELERGLQARLVLNSW